MNSAIEASTTPLAGVLLLKPRVFNDARGSFVKTFHEGIFRDFGLDFAVREEFFSTSHRGVIRGMHFQTPPADHAKLVYCLVGSVLDVVLDLRRDSSTFGRFHSQELSEENRFSLLIPSGFAHGFLALSEGATMVYKTTSVHAPECDAGIRWDGFGFTWPVSDPVVSGRDATFPSLAEFASPF